jgi:peptidoglycan LD-endopeptidase CwlK
MASRKLSDLEPVTRELVKRLMNRMAELGHPIIPYCTYRSGEEQDELYAKGRTTEGKIVTYKKAGTSPHNYKMAADVFFKDTGFKGPWDILGAEAKAIGLVWGGSWKMKDLPHVERPGWRKIANV